MSTNPMPETKPLDLEKIKAERAWEGTIDPQEYPCTAEAAIENLRTLRNALIAEVERLRAEQWRPIETAPKDGHYLVYLKEPSLGRHVHSCSAHPNISTIGHQFAFDLPPATHWMPLPEPPAEIRKGLKNDKN